GAAGHPTGDRVLVQIAQVLSGSVRGTDFVARYGGEEFAVLLPFCPADRSVEVAERIRAAIASQEFPVGRVTVSIGVSTTSPGAEIGEDQLIESADSALYRAKRAGRNCVFHCGAPSSERDSA
ncbi:MAG: GGDEF domain-containing protein, partial [Fimbriimonadaceae bacterium]